MCRYRHASNLQHNLDRGMITTSRVSISIDRVAAQSQSRERLNSQAGQLLFLRELCGIVPESRVIRCDERYKARSTGLLGPRLRGSGIV